MTGLQTAVLTLALVALALGLLVVCLLFAIADAGSATLSLGRISRPTRPAGFVILATRRLRERDVRRHPDDGLTNRVGGAAPGTPASLSVR